MLIFQWAMPIPCPNDDGECAVVRVAFELPDASEIVYAGVEDLLFMSITRMAALIAARRVSCVEVVSFFIDKKEQTNKPKGKQANKAKSL